MQLLRLSTAADGESDFDMIDYDMRLLDDSPPAKPHWFSDPQTAKAWAYVRCPVGWDGGLHPTPRRQIIVCTAGSIRVSSSRGDGKQNLAIGTLLPMQEDLADTDALLRTVLLLHRARS